MEALFLSTIFFIFLMIVLHCVSLYSEIKWKKMTSLFKNNAFFVHSFMSLTTWTVTFVLIVILQLNDYPRFLLPDIVIFLGYPIIVLGIIIAMSGFVTLGLRRSLHINIFDPSTIKKIGTGIYKFINDPEYLGFYIILIGFICVTDSIYNLVITLEFLILMIPLRTIENIPFTKL